VRALRWIAEGEAIAAGVSVVRILAMEHRPFGVGTNVQCWHLCEVVWPDHLSPPFDAVRVAGASKIPSKIHFGRISDELEGNSTSVRTLHPDEWGYGPDWL